MIKLLDVYMPEHMQADLLADHETIAQRRSSSALDVASEWFLKKINELEPTVPTNERDQLHTKVYTGSYHTGQTANSDIHLDAAPTTAPSTKYLLTVGNNQRVNTLFFPDGNEVLGRYKTEHLFEADRLGELTLREGIELNWLHATNGQICRFDRTTAYHAAAPMFPDDIKILMSIVFR